MFVDLMEIQECDNVPAVTSRQKNQYCRKAALSAARVGIFLHIVKVWYAHQFCIIIIVKVLVFKLFPLSHSKSVLPKV